jgi:GNAT superfamily N-acetyltransferase
MPNLVARTAAHTDVTRLVALNRAAYPELLADGIVFDAPQIAAHQTAYTEGQIVVSDGTEIVGAIATLIVPSARCLAPHTWVGITSHGTFAAHDPKGDTLYLADIYSDPRARGRGVGAALYGALFALCRRRRLTRVVAGGRLWGYHEVADRMSPDEYVAEVARGVRRDRVLTTQLGVGFELTGVLHGYLDDWRSRDFASHLVWTNDAVVRDGVLRPSHAASSSSRASR